eukprot:5195965-Prymnesium_polylepis.2
MCVFVCHAILYRPRRRSVQLHAGVQLCLRFGRKELELLAAAPRTPPRETPAPYRNKVFTMSP